MGIAFALPILRAIRWLRRYRSSSGCTHLYGVICRCSVSLIMRTGGA
jgi:hypothetical protein